MVVELAQVIWPKPTRCRHCVQCRVRPVPTAKRWRHDPCFNGNPRTSELGQVASLREARSVNSSRRWARGVSTDSPPRGINAQRRAAKPACWLEGPPTLSQRPSSEKILKHLRVCKIQLVYASAVQLKNDRLCTPTFVPMKS